MKADPVVPAIAAAPPPPTRPLAVPAIALACVVALALAPSVLPGFVSDLIAKALVMAIFAMSLDLLVGCTGLVSFGHAAFFGIAAYATAWASKLVPGGTNLLLALPLAVAASALAALLVGALALRTRGVYFIMVTLAFSQMFLFLFQDTPLGGGSDGIYLAGTAQLVLGSASVEFGDPLHFYALALVLATLTALGLGHLLRTPFGQVLAGIRLNEQRMRSLGYRSFGYKLAVFTLAGACAGTAGYLSAAQYGFVNPESLAWHYSGLALLMVILGGSGRIWGAALGAFAIVLLQELFALQTKHWQLPMGCAIVAIVLFAPGGLRRLLERAWQRVASR
jgi:branched-chain amino acid transport system permease protein